MNTPGTFIYEIMTDPVFITFLAVFGGLALGRISYRGFTLGTSGVFFMGFLLGVFDLHCSKYITTFGLIIFMYALGIQGGPSFFNALSRKGVPYIIITLTVILSSIIFTLLAGFLFKFTAVDILGMYTGAFNNSSALAILMEGGWGQALLPSYGIVYPLGLVSVIIFVQLVPILQRKNIVKEFKEHYENQQDGTNHLILRKFLVENPSVLGKKLDDLNLKEKTESTISRIRRKGKIIIPGPDTLLRLNDVVLAVGPAGGLEELHRMLGQETHEDMEIDPQVEARWIIITNPSLHRVDLDHLGLSDHYHTVVTRIWRSGMEFAPVNNFVIELGDSLLAVGKKRNLDRLVRFLGKREKALGEIDLISMCFGIALGIIIGKITLPIPAIGTLTIGVSGGALLMGLSLGYVRHFGFLTGQMSPSAKLVIKELGLSLFIAGIGATAGSGLVDVTSLQLIKMLASSSAILFLTMATTFFIASYVLKMDLVKALACICGGMVSSTALGTLSNTINSEEPSYVFAACYPLALFGSIIGTQVLAILVR
jgi:putative transport protein